MRIYGKVFGAVLGWMLMRHPAGAVLGAVLGHVFDAGWLFPDKSSGGQGQKALALEEAYRTLGVEPAASDEEVERAFRRKISDYHPDKVSGAAEEIRSLAESRAREINSAYEAIQKARKANSGE
ncbi:J domain-containing protein [Pseudomarimonas salicorniae]|uniref:DnaJ domain-containing protein n=1 Tax=Pseudomarimonas salicorniae TaxID=2933270 RepID=A0ABT0GHV8_9GAMM|nr:DnaJ domain-containing protein [Lysobacter sp. CAU 1642]MCK7593927.1 DnaJ domain-containing protein [Lysobacter sp. CAU 1642]